MNDKANESITETFARDFLEKYLNAWNSKKPENILTLATEDVTWDDPTIPGGHAKGHKEVHIWLTSFWRAFPDISFDYLAGNRGGAAISFDRKRLIAPWQCKGTWLGTIDPPGLLPNGANLDITGVDMYGFINEKICYVKTITDVQEGRQQLGLAPKNGSLQEKLAVGFQRTIVKLSGNWF